MRLMCCERDTLLLGKQSTSVMIMKLLGILFLVSVSQFVTTHGASGLPKLGSCKFKEYTMKMRSCTTEFFVNMTSDPNGPCRPKFMALKDCAVEKLKTCVPSLSRDKTVRNKVERNFNEKTYCENAGIEYATLYPKVSPVPCARAYYQEVPECYNKTLRLWQANRSDKRLCCEYAKAKLCDKYLIAVHCIVFHVYREAKKLIDLHYDDYNPFCMPDKVPPPSHAAVNKTVRVNKTTSASWSILNYHHGSFINVLVSYWLMTIIFGSLIIIC